MDIIENNLVTAIREIVRQEIKSQVSDDIFLTRTDVEKYIADEGYNLISDEIDEAIGNYLRNNVTVEINT